MKLLTILIITIVAENGHRYSVELPMLSAESCGAAITPVADAIRHDWPHYLVQCQRTQIVTVSPRPKARPEHLKG